MVVCTSEAALREAIGGLTMRDFQDRREPLEANRLRAKRYADAATTIAEVLLTDRDAEPGPRTREQ